MTFIAWIIARLSRGPMPLYRLDSSCPAADPSCQPGCVQSSLAEHSSGPALLTCFHGPACVALRCTCTPHHGSHHIGGGDLVVIDHIESRDIAWLAAPLCARGLVPRQITAIRPSVGDMLTVDLPTGLIKVKVSALPNRDADPASPAELQVDCNFSPGDSGSPVFDSKNRVVAVVRNTTGRCGFVLP